MKPSHYHRKSNSSQVSTSVQSESSWFDFAKSLFVQTCFVVGLGTAVTQGAEGFKKFFSSSSSELKSEVHSLSVATHSNPDIQMNTSTNTYEVQHQSAGSAFRSSSDLSSAAAEVVVNTDPAPESSPAAENAVVAPENAESVVTNEVNPAVFAAPVMMEAGYSEESSNRMPDRSLSGSMTGNQTGLLPNALPDANLAGGLGIQKPATPNSPSSYGSFPSAGAGQVSGNPVTSESAEITSADRTALIKSFNANFADRMEHVKGKACSRPGQCVDGENIEMHSLRWSKNSGIKMNDTTLVGSNAAEGDSVQFKLTFKIQTRVGNRTSEYPVTLNLQSASQPTVEVQGSNRIIRFKFQDQTVREGALKNLELSFAIQAGAVVPASSQLSFVRNSFEAVSDRFDPQSTTNPSAAYIIVDSLKYSLSLQ
jgi:hypothetical protein